MRRFWPLLILAVIFVYAWLQHAGEDVPLSPASSPAQRIISLAPSITETLFAVGAGKQVIAVTDFCLYPAEAKTRPKVGGYLNPSLERIVGLQPDLVILLDRQQQLINQLIRLGIPTLAINNASLEGILKSIIQIGEHAGHADQAQALLNTIEQRIESVKQQVAGRHKPRTMLAIAHYTDSEQLDTVYVAGQHDFYHDLLELAGGINVYQGRHLKVPTISAEGILQLDPEVIIDIFPAAEAHQADLQKVRSQWQQFGQIEAVRQQRVHILQASYATIPGPRVIELLEDFAVILHPQKQELQPANVD